jgi:hypothetical protein
MARYETVNITGDFLEKNPNSYYVFPDNFQHSGTELTTLLRDYEHTFGFTVKKFGDTDDSSFYKPEEYAAIFFEQLIKLKKLIEQNSDKTFYIAKMDCASINKYRIWETLIHHNLTLKLNKYNNVVFCWEDKLV